MTRSVLTKTIVLTLAAALAAVSWNARNARAAAPVPVEYLVVSSAVPFGRAGEAAMQTELNKYGKDGWHLVTVEPAITKMIFKR